MAEELMNSENEFSSVAGAPERQQSDVSYNERTQKVFVSAYAAERIEEAKEPASWCSQS
jgi:valyl-tRNA synthetase